MMNILIQFCVTALVTVAATTTAFAQGAEGLWISRPATCASLGDGGWVKIDRQGIHFYESTCRFGRTAPAGFPGMKGTVTCDGEGETWTQNVSMSVQGDQLTLSGVGRPKVYRRCAVGQSAQASSAGGAEAAAAALLIGAILYKELRD